MKVSSKTGPCTPVTQKPWQALRKNWSPKQQIGPLGQGTVSYGFRTGTEDVPWSMGYGFVRFCTVGFFSGYVSCLSE